MSALRSGSYRWLLAGTTINQFGNAIAPVALAFAVLDLGGSATQLGLVVAAYAMADVVAVLYGGVLGDRVSRRLLMTAANLCAALSQAVAAASLLGGWSSLPLLTVLGAANGALGALASPATRAVLPQTVPAESLRSAIAQLRISANVASIVGFGAAGMVVAALGSGAALAIDALTFAVAALCFAGLRVRAVGAEREPSHMLADLKEGAVEVFRHTWLWALILMATVYHLFYGGAQGVLGPIVVGRDLGRAAWGWALAAMMLGFVVGGLVSLVWKPRRALLVGQFHLALTAAFPAAMAWSDQVWVVLLGAALHGYGLEIFSVGWDLSIMENVPEHLLARVNAFDQIGSFIARPIGLAATGLIAQATGERTWLAVVAVVLLVTDLAPLLLRDVRRLERRPTTRPVAPFGADGGQ